MKFALFVALALVSTAIFWASANNTVARKKARGRKEFSTVRLDSKDPRFEFSAESSEVVHEEETGLDPRTSSSKHYCLTIYARNPHGEYFMFKSGQQKSYVKHVSHDMARMVLGSKYCSPDSGAVRSQSAPSASSGCFINH